MVMAWAVAVEDEGAVVALVVKVWAVDEEGR